MSNNFTLRTSSDLLVNAHSLPLVIPIRVNKEFLEASKESLNLIFNLDGSAKEIVCDGVKYPLKPNGAVGDNEQGSTEYTSSGKPTVKYSMPALVNKARLKEIGKEEEAARKGKKSVFLDDIHVVKGVGGRKVHGKSSSINGKSSPITKRNSSPMGRASGARKIDRNFVPATASHSPLGVSPIPRFQHSPASNVPSSKQSTTKPISISRGIAIPSSRPQTSSLVDLPSFVVTPAINQNGITSTASQIDSNLSAPFISHSKTSSDPGPQQLPSSASLHLQMIHFLALAPRDLATCCTKTGAASSTVSEILNKIGKPQTSNPLMFQLRSEHFKDITPYTWDGYSPVEIEKAIKNASAAYNELGIPKDSPFRKNIKSPTTKRKSLETNEDIIRKKGTGVVEVKKASPAPVLKKVETKTDIRNIAVPKQQHRPIAIPLSKNGSSGSLSSAIKPRTQKAVKAIRRLGIKDWDCMNIRDLESYSGWLKAQRLLLIEKLKSVSTFSRDTLKIALFEKDKEFERTAIVKNHLKIKGFSTDPSVFLTQVASNMALLDRVDEELREFDAYIKNIAGSVDYQMEAL